MFGFLKKNNKKQESNLRLVNVLLNDVEEAYNLINIASVYIDSYAFVYLQKESNGIKVIIEANWCEIIAMGTEEDACFIESFYSNFPEWEINRENKIYMYKFYPFDFYGTWDNFLVYFWSEAKSKHSDWTISRNILQMWVD